MWLECWGLVVGQDLPLTEQAFLREHFNAWQGPGLPPQQPVAQVSWLPAQEAGHARAREHAMLLSMPVPGFGGSIDVFKPTDDSWALSYKDSLCIVTEAQETRFHVRCNGAHAAMLLLVALTDVYRACGWLTVHASGCRTVEGQMQLCLGRSGAGKSTHAMSKVLAGCSFVAEDRAWLRASDLLVVPRDRRLRLWPKGAALLPSLPVSEATLDTDGKLRFALHLLGLTPADPVPLQSWDLLLGEMPGDPLPALAALRESQRLLMLSQALWEALGMPYLPQAKAHTASAIQRLLKLPARAYWRTASGQLRSI